MGSKDIEFVKKNSDDPSDPFLLACTNYEIDNSMIIRIRAC